MTDQELVERAFAMHQFSYAPYSRTPGRLDHPCHRGPGTGLLLALRKLPPDAL